MAGIRKKPLKSGRFQAFFVTWEGKRKFLTGPKPEANTQRARRKAEAEALRLAETLEEEHRQIRKGYRPAPKSADTHAKRPIGEVIEEYLSWGRSQGGRNGCPWGRTHARERANKLAWWQERLSLSTLGDLQGVLPRVEAALREIQAKGRTGKTCANYVEGLHGFCLWAKRRGFLDHDPLEGMAAFDTTPQTKRRALTPEEIWAILEVAPEHRRILYETAFATGLRAGELRALTVKSLDMERPALVLDPAWTKNRKPGIQPIPKALAAKLRAFAEAGTAKALCSRHYRRKDARPDATPDDPLLFVPTHTARDLREDMEAANIPAFIPGEGKADFHSCRVAYVTFVIEAGANAKEGQALARHATPELTMNIYARARNERLSEIAEKVGETLFAEPKRVQRVHRLAAGAEALSDNALQANDLQGVSYGGGGGNRTRVP